VTQPLANTGSLADERALVVPTGGEDPCVGSLRGGGVSCGASRQARAERASLTSAAMSSEASATNARTLASNEAAADRYAERQPAAAPAALLAFLDAIAGSLPPGGRVLEIGSATGHDAALLEARGLRVHRTDAARAFVEQLRSRGLEAEILNVIWVQVVCSG